MSERLRAKEEGSSVFGEDERDGTGGGGGGGGGTGGGVVGVVVAI